MFLLIIIYLYTEQLKTIFSEMTLSLYELARSIKPTEN